MFPREPTSKPQLRFESLRFGNRVDWDCEIMTFIEALLKEEREKYIKIGYSNALNDRVKNIKKNLTTK